MKIEFTFSLGDDKELFDEFLASLQEESNRDEAADDLAKEYNPRIAIDDEIVRNPDFTGDKYFITLLVEDSRLVYHYEVLSVGNEGDLAEATRTILADNDWHFGATMNT